MASGLDASVVTTGGDAERCVLCHSWVPGDGLLFTLTVTPLARATLAANEAAAFAHCCRFISLHVEQVLHEANVAYAGRVAGWAIRKVRRQSEATM